MFAEPKSYTQIQAIEKYVKRYVKFKMNEK